VYRESVQGTNASPRHTIKCVLSSSCIECQMRSLIVSTHDPQQPNAYIDGPLYALVIISQGIRSKNINAEAMTQVQQFMMLLLLQQNYKCKQAWIPLVSSAWSGDYTGLSSLIGTCLAYQDFPHSSQHLWHHQKHTASPLPLQQGRPAVATAYLNVFPK